MVSDRVMDAIESGIITGSRKPLHPGRVVATFAMGSRALYDYIDNNPLFEMHPADYTNNPFVIAQNHRMVAINSALEQEAWERRILPARLQEASDGRRDRSLT